MQQRNITYDLMKGVAIILMMVCHLILHDSGTICHSIYSFHMPLFFILAGVFAKDLSAISSFRQVTIKNAQRLLLPFVVTMLLRCAWGGLQAYFKHNVSYIMRPLLALLWLTPEELATQWGTVYTGPMWFLVALFLVRELFIGIQYALRNVNDKYRDAIIVAISIFISLCSVLIHPYIPSLPFCILQTGTAMGFYAVGWYVSRHSLPKWIYALCVLVWPLAIVYGNISLAACSISYYPLSFIGACGGTYVVYMLCKGWGSVLSKVNTINIISPITWCGMYSLPILCMHELELYSGYIYSVACKVPSLSFIEGWGEIGLAIAMALLVMHIPYIKKVYV